MLKLIKSFLSSPRSAPRRISRSRTAKCGREVSLLESRCLLSGVYSIAADSMAASRPLDAPLRTGQAAIVQEQLYFAAGWQNELAFEAPLNQLWVTNGTSSGSRHLKTFFGEISELTAVGTTLFFSVDDGVHGTELWKTDGTPVGTVLVRDVSAGQAASGPSRLTAVSDALYFTADDGVHGRELWRSDGTASGTQLVADIAPGTQGSDPGELTAWGQLIAFTAATPGFGRELWTSGGLAATTQQVRDIHSGSSDSSPANLRVFGSDLYFSASDGTHGHELWKSDGTTGGTTLVRDIAPGPTGSSPREFSIFDNQLVFTADDGIHGRELWKTDGSDSGTSLIADLNFGRDSSDAEGFVVAGGFLFFAADDGIHGREIWKSDATNAGSVMLRDLEPGEFGSGPTDLTVLNNSVYFVAWDSINGRELRITDGTPERTGLLNNLAPGQASAFFNRQALWKLNGNLLFASIDERNIDHLWITDGTPLGTARLEVAPPTTLGAAPSDLIVLGNEVIYAATDAVHGRELWISNGTEIGTRLLADLNPGLADSSPSQPVLVDGSVFFIAETKDYGQELWKTNGTSAETTLVADLRPGSAGSAIRSLTAVGSTLFFVADNGVLGPELWKSDGTSAGTVPVVDLRIGSEGSNPEQLTALNGTLFFTANNGVVGQELWASNGTAAGTVLVSDIRPGAAGSTIQELTTHAGMLFFTADNGSQGREIWKSSGTTATTSQIIDLRAGSLGSDPRQLTSSSSRLYFTANDGASGVELWSTDGSAAGTTQVADIRPGSSSSLPEQLIAAADRIYFTAHDGVHGRELWTAGAGSPAANLLADLTPGPVGSEIILHAASTAHLWYSQYSFLADSQALWKIDLQSSKRERLTSVADDVGSDLNLVIRGSDAVFTADDGVRGTELWISDGTAAGTRLVADSNRSNGGSQPAEMLTVGNRVIYTSDDGTYGRELWISDGTPAGTRLLADLNRGSGSSNPEQLTLINGVVFFTADDGLSGRELWKTDTTTAGTVRVRDIRSGSASSAIHSLTRVGSTLFFVADDGSSGAEVWKSNGTTAGTTRVTDLRTGAVGSNPRHLTALNELLYFTADDGASGSELWRSDGSSAGTSLVRDVRAGALGSAISELAVHANRLYFVADDGNTGAELWVSDGQASGTRLVTDLATGASGSFPAQLTSTPDRLYFTAGTPGTGTELWSTDGSAQGTSLVADLRPGSASASPAQLRAVGGRLFFSADDPVHGRELRVTNAAGNAVLLLADLTPGTVSTTFVDPVPFGSSLLVSVYNQANTGQPLLINADGVINVPLPAQTSQPVRNASRFSGTENAVFFSGTSDSHATELYHLRNTTPQLDALAQRQIPEDAAEQSVSLSGIAAGGGESQFLRVTATSSNTILIPNPTISYTSPGTSGTLRFQPTANRSGTATITVTVEDGGLDNDLSTAADNATFSRQLVVEVTPVNDVPTLGTLDSLSVAEDSGMGSVPLSGISAGGGESQVLRVFAVSSNTTLIPAPSVTYSSPAATGTLQFTPSANLSGEATITVSVEDGGLDDNLATTADNAVFSRSFILTVTPVNDPPTLDSVNNISLEEDAAEQMVSLAGISAGGGESQTLRVTATSSNLGLIPNPTVTYTSANATGSLRFQPVPNASGIAIITVSVEDGGLDNNLNTTADNGLTTQSFRVTVGAINDLPTLDAIPALTIAEDAAESSVNLTGITAGGGEAQPLRVTVGSADSGLLSTLTIDYTSPNATGTLRLQPVADASGATTITVRVEDGGLDGDLSTAADNAIFTRSFLLTVEARNDAPTLNALNDLTFAEDSGSHSVSLAGITAGGGESQKLLVTAVSSNTSIIPAPTVTYTSPNSTGVLQIRTQPDAVGKSVITVTVEDAGLDNDPATKADNASYSRSFEVTVSQVNDAPTLNALDSLAVNEDATEQSISLSGITAGGGESQVLRVTANSSNTTLIPNPTISYTSPAASGTLKFQPTANRSGTATITVTVEDGGLDNDLSTAADNAAFARQFVVEVNPVNDVPTLGTLDSLSVAEDSGTGSVSLSGISAGGGESQVLRVIAVSSNPTLIPAPAITYSSPSATGTLQFTPSANLSGDATITVTVEDGGLDDNLSTTTDNAVFSRSFLLTVTPVNDSPTLDSLSNLSLDEDAAEQTVALTGISAGGGESQNLRVTASSNNLGLIPNPTVTYASANASGSLRFQPVINASGTATITVSVEDGGLDNNLNTTADNATTTQTFRVTVVSTNDLPTLDTISPLTLAEDAAEYSVNLTGITAGGGETQPLRVTATSGDSGLLSTLAVDYTSANTTGVLRLKPAVDTSGAATITVRVEDGGLDSDLSTVADNAVFTRNFLLTVEARNDVPTLNALNDLTIAEDSGSHSVSLAGITAGGGESQTLRVTVSSSHASIVPVPTVTYNSPNSTGVLQIHTLPDAAGKSVITVTVEDAGLDNDLATTADNATYSRSFEVTVSQVNDAPTLNALDPRSINEDAAEQSVSLNGITAGGGESQILRIIATSSNSALIPHPSISYTSPAASGTLKFQPVSDRSGTATITVTVEDGGLDNDLSTAADNAISSRQFAVEVNPVNDVPTLGTLDSLSVAEDSGSASVSLSGISAGGGESQALRVFAVSSNTTLIPAPSVTYSSPEAIGTLQLTPSANLSGEATITVSVEDGGLDDNLATTADNAVFSRFFVVTVTPVNDSPTLDSLENISLEEDAPEQTVSLTGISAGGGESQNLRVTATSNNLALIPNPTVTYTSANVSGSLRFQPVANASGSATITVSVEDGGLDNNLNTTADNGLTTRTFLVTVGATNDLPTLDTISSVTIAEDAAESSVNLTGITAGGGEAQPLRVTATSGNTSLLSTLAVDYTSANVSGTFRLKPAMDASGTATITITVEDGGLDGNLSTAADNAIFTRSFLLTVDPRNDAPTLNAVNDLTIAEDSGSHSVSLAGITAGGSEAQTLRVTAVSSNTSIIPAPTVTYTSPNSTGVLQIRTQPDAAGKSVITVTVEDAGLDNDLATTADNAMFSRSFEVTVSQVNDAPTLNALDSLTILEDAAEQSVSLSGITAGGGESQALRVTATSSNTTLVPNPTISYTSPAASGTLKFQPTANRSGTATITVTVEDGGLDNDLATAADNAAFARQFVVEVTPVNDLPTLGSLNSLSVAEDSGTGSVSLSGIAAGGGESQVLRVFAVSSNATLIPTPAVTYSSPSDTGTLQFTPSANLSGEATITVTVEDGGLDDNLATTADNAVASRSFVLTVTPVNDPPTLDALSNINLEEDASEQTVSLTGISAGGGESQPLRVTATSSNLALIPNPTVTYTSANSSGSLRFQPVQNTSGSATITVSVEDGGLDNNLNSTADNGLTVHSFRVIVGSTNDLPTLDAISSVTVAEDAAESSVSLSGITAGGGETQPLRVTAAAGNSGLLSTLVVDYTSANSTGTLRLKPAADRWGSSTITVTVEDGGLDTDLSTVADNAVFTRSFLLTVEPRNDPPTLNALNNLTIAEDSGSHSVSLAGITAGGSESQTLRVTAVSSNTSIIPTPAITYTSPDSTGVLQIRTQPDAAGKSVITVTVEDAGLDNDLATAADNAVYSRSFEVTVSQVNDAPTLNALDSLKVNEDTSEQTVSLSGIAAGGGESQVLRVTATSSDTTLIPNPPITYTSPQATGTLRFQPAANRFGTATITVSVEDGGLDNDLSTAADNATFDRQFVVDVNPVNDVPTLAALNSLSVAEDSGTGSVTLSGITAGGGESQVLRIIAVSSNTTLIPAPSVTYTSPAATGTLQFTPSANLSGEATITVSVEDGGLDDNLATTADNALFSRSFVLTVTPVNDPPTLDALGNISLEEDAAEQTVSLNGISAGEGESQNLRVTATSSNLGLVPNPTVTYTSANTSGSLRFQPVTNASGSATITVTVEDGGLDNNLNTTADNGLTSQTFRVIVGATNDLPTLDAISAVTIAEDAAESSVNLTGITAGGGETQPLRITATSQNASLLSTLAVDYTSANTTGTLRLKPSADASGTATITVRVEDGGLDGDLSTAADNGAYTRSFVLTVDPRNDVPALNALNHLTIAEDSGSHSVALAGIAAGGGESQSLRVTAVSSNTSIIPAPNVTYTSPNSTGVLTIRTLSDSTGKSVITVTVEDAGLDNDLATIADNATFSRSFEVTVSQVNDAPTLNALDSRTISEDAAEQTVSLSGITAGGGESQVLRVTATSSNTTLIPNPTISYSSPEASGTLKFQPAANGYGTATITVTVEDGGPDNDLSTAADNAAFTRQFAVDVNPVNDPPTLGSLNSLSVNEDSGPASVTLSGIAAGGGESQVLRVIAVSSNTTLIPAPSVTYTSPAATGTLQFTPSANLSGEATITVSVEDGGLDNNLATTADNAVFSRSFVLTVTPVNDLPTLDSLGNINLEEDASEQTVSLTGISAGGGESQNLRVTAASSNPGLVPNPTVTYTSANTSGSLRFQPVTNASGSATITVAVEDGGLDNNLNTTADNGVTNQTFHVTVGTINDLPTLDAISAVTIAEDAAEYSVNLTGITAGGGETQPLRVTAASQNASLLSTLAVDYTSANTTGTLRLRPTVDASGIATIVVRVEDGGLDGDLSTAADNGAYTRSFLLTVDPRNDIPALNALNHLTIAEDSGSHSVSLAGIAAGGGESQSLRVTAVSSNTSIIPAPNVTYTSPNSTGVLTIRTLSDTTGKSVITVTVEDAGLDNDLATIADNATFSRSFEVTVSQVNDAPTLNALDSRSISEDAAEQTISLSGITAGGGESQGLRVAATSSNTTLIPNPTSSYTSPEASGTLKFQPVANRSGTATITVTMEDGGLDNDLSTAADNATFARQFVVDVNPVNDGPTLAALNSLSVAEDSGIGSVTLSGITAGGGESQVLRVIAVSSNTTLIPAPSVTYISPAATGTLQFTPSANLSGEATITVSVEDGGLDDNLATTADNAVFSRSFVLTVTPVNDPPTLDALSNISLEEDASEQTVPLTGISAGGGESQNLRVTATSNTLGLIPNPTVTYTSANASGSLRFQPVTNASGTATITVAVEDGGLDNNLNTTADNGVTNRTFRVVVGSVNDLPTLDAITAVTIAEDAAEYSVNLTGITAGGGEAQPLRVTAASGTGSLLSTLAVDYTSASTTGTLRLKPAPDLSGTTTITVRVEDGGLDGDLSTVADNAVFTRSFLLTIEARNDAPTLNSLSDLTIAEDSGSHTVSLAGISAGGGESQTLRVTSSSSVPDLLSDATVTYTSPNTTGFLRLQPMLNASGQAFITVRVEDAGADNNLQTTSDNAWFEQRFLLTVTPVNDSPTIDAVANLEIQEDSGDQTIFLTDITAGAGESQSIRVTAASSDTLLFADPQVTYVSAETTARLKFRPEDEMFGDATITVTVEDGGLDNNLSTAADNATTTRTITVSVKSVNDAPTLDPVADITINEDSGLQTVELTGIGPGDDPGEVFRVRAVSSNWKLVPDPSIEVSRLFGNGVMSFTPVRDQFGTAEITISVEDGGDDDKLSTPDDNRTFSRTLRLTVLPVNDPPTIRQVDDLVVAEDCGEVLVDLKRITAGEGESQPIRLSAIGTPSSVIEAVSLSWNSPEPIGTLRFRPVKDAFGNAQLRVIVEDGGDDADLGTRGDNLSFEMSFQVTVTPVNDAPTLDLISDVAVDEDTVTFEVPLAGITAGGAEQQSLRITAISADRTLVPDPQVVYSSANANGSLVFSPVSHQYGTASITVVVEDAGFDGDFATPADNARMVREFAVHIRPINDPPYFLPLSDIVLPEDFSPLEIPLEGVSSGFNESDLLRVFASAEPAGIVTIHEVTLSGAAGRLVLLPVADQSGRTVITVTLEDAGLDRDFLTAADNLSLTRTFSVEVRPVNDKPTLDPVNDVVLNEDSAEYAIDLSGITAGGGETQPLAVTAVSNNPDLLSELSVLFVPGNHTATLKFHPLPNRYGSAVVSISVEDGGPDGRLDTRQDNASETRDFVVTISPVNDAPSVDTIPRLIVEEDSPETVVHLTGISAGPYEAQKIRISATSSNPSVVPDPAVQYNSAEVTGRLILKPAAEASGSSTITVTVEDSGLDGDLTTVSDNARFVREFEVVVDAVNDSPQMNPVADLQLTEDFGQYTIQLTGIGAGSTENQDLRITASVSAAELLGDIRIDYISPASTAVLTLRSLADRSGSAIVSIRLEDAGFDQDLATGTDNASRVYEFRLTVNPVNDPPTLKAPASLVISRNSPTVTVTATAIGAGPLEDQPLRVWASSSQPAIVKSVQVVYNAGADSAALSFAPVLNAVGSTTITVFVEDGGLDRDLQTLADNRTSYAAFSVTVVANVPQITAPGATTVAQRPTLSWTSLPDAVAYEVWMRNATTGANPFYQAVSDTNSHAISRDLGIGSMELWVRGVRRDGSLMPWTPTYRFNVVTPPVVAAISARQQTARPTISWNALTPASGYDIWLTNASSGQSQFVRKTITGTSWTPDEDLPIGRYYFWVRGTAANAFFTNWSQRIIFDVVPIPTAIRPTVSTFSRRPTFEWSAPVGATSYGIQVRSYVTGQWIADLRGLNEPRWTPSVDLESGTYAWLGVAYSAQAGFYSSWTRRIEFFVGGRSQVIAPESPSVSASPRIEWTRVEDVDYYVLWVNSDTQGAKFIYETGLSAPAYQVPVQLQRGVKYRVWVQAISLTGEVGPWSAAYEFTVASDQAESSDSDIPESQLALLAPNLQNSNIRDIPKFPDDHVNSGDTASTSPANETPFPLTTLNSANQPEMHQLLKSAVASEAAQTDELRLLDMVFENTVFEMLEVITAPA